MRESLQHQIVLILLLITTLASVVAGEESPDNGDTDEDFLCRPSTPTSIIKFLLVNYVAHCATIVMPPGNKPIPIFVFTVGSFLFPTLGSDMAWSAIIRHARLKRGSQLRRAARAGAFCIVVRTPEWEPKTGDYIDLRPTDSAPSESDEQTVPLRALDANAENGFEHYDTDSFNNERITSLPSSSSVYNYYLKNIANLDEPLLGWYNTKVNRAAVHGSSVIPPGYQLRVVPSDAQVMSNTEAVDEPTSSDIVKPMVSSVYNIPKTVIGLIQVTYAGYTLNKARGHQIEQYGYAAFGLTVTQYLVMSILNLIAQAVNPTYPTMYMVRSPEMDEAERRGGIFDGVIGRLVPDTEIDRGNRRAKFLNADHEDDRPISALCWAQSANEDQAKTVQLQETGSSLAHYSVPTCTPFKVVTSRRKFRERRGYDSEWDRLLELLPLIFCTISIVIIGLVSSGFSKGQSTLAQRAWTMSWLLSGYAINLLIHFEAHLTGTTGDVIGGLILCLSVTSVVGGFVVVIQMLIAYGDCIIWG